MAVDLTAAEQRAHDPEFIAACQWKTWRARLPLHWPTPPNTRSSPKTAYHSHYVHLGCDDLERPATWEPLSDSTQWVTDVASGKLRRQVALDLLYGQVKKSCRRRRLAQSLP